MTRYLDPLLLWTVAATATSRMRLNASTLSTFYYEPPHLARLLTTLDVLSDGRLDVGVGLGWMKDEHDIARGADWHRRSLRVVAAITVRRLLPAEVYEDPAEVVRVLLHPVVQRLYLLTFEEAQHALLQRTGTLARNDLHQRRFLGHRLIDDRPQGTIDLTTTVVDLMQVELQLHTPHSPTRRREQPEESVNGVSA
jgi:Luciferase-like monooxygenase